MRRVTSGEVDYVVFTPNWTLVSDPGRPPVGPETAPVKLQGLANDAHAAIRAGSGAPATHSPILMAEGCQTLLNQATQEVARYRRTLGLPAAPGS